MLQCEQGRVARGIAELLARHAAVGQQFSDRIIERALAPAHARRAFDLERAHKTNRKQKRDPCHDHGHNHADEPSSARARNPHARADRDRRPNKQRQRADKKPHKTSRGTHGRRRQLGEGNTTPFEKRAPLRGNRNTIAHARSVKQRELCAVRADFRTHRRDGRRIAGRSEHAVDPRGDKFHVGFLQAARGECGRAEAQAAGEHR